MIPSQNKGTWTEGFFRERSVHAIQLNDAPSAKCQMLIIWKKTGIRS
jgi:hypothetical protein